MEPRIVRILPALAAGILVSAGMTGCVHRTNAAAETEDTGETRHDYAALRQEATQRLTSPVVLGETNAVGLPGCVWRTAPWDGGQLLLIINLGRSEARLDIGTETPCRDMITGARPVRKLVGPANRVA